MSSSQPPARHQHDRRFQTAIGSLEDPSCPVQTMLDQIVDDARVREG